MAPWKALTGQGFGREVVISLVEWGHASLGKGSFTYPVAVTKHCQPGEIAENLHGEFIGNRTNPKYDSVVYRIPFCGSSIFCIDPDSSSLQQFSVANLHD